MNTRIIHQPQPYALQPLPRPARRPKKTRPSLATFARAGVAMILALPGVHRRWAGLALVASLRASLQPV